MSKLLTSIAAVALMGAAAMPLPAQAAERSGGITNTQAQSTELSSQRRHWRHHRHVYRHHGYRHRHYGYYSPRYYYADPYPYGYRSYGYRPGIAFGIGPFGFGVF